MESLHRWVFWSTLAIEATALAFAVYVMIWVFAALEVVL